MGSKTPPPDIAERIQLRKDIKNEISSYPIVIYSKPRCGYCDLAKDLFSQEKLKFKEFDLNSIALKSPDTYKNYINALIDITKLKTVPQIFICGKFIGGYVDLHQISQENRLLELVAECSG
uniref:Glutaredoxin domain-containing protein n=1 Tax=Acrobeloides nanus TaxID=290746 RepID=A0A914CA44_9BILA